MSGLFNFTLKLTLSLAGLLVSLSTAQACTFASLVDEESGRSYHYYRAGFTLPETQNLLTEKRFISIVKTRLTKHFVEDTGYTVSAFQYETVENLHGNILSLPDGRYIDASQDISNGGYGISYIDTFGDKLKATEENNGLNFKIWESLKIPSPRIKMVLEHDDCNSFAPQLNLQPNSLYLTFGYIRNDGSTHISDAIKLKSKRDPIVKAFRSFADDDENAPNKMSAETYFKNMTGFAEVSIHKCPSNNDFLYKDSRFTKAENQINELFSVKDSYNIKDSDLNIQDFSYYLNKLKRRMMPNSFTAVTCEYEDILVLKTHYDKYLPIIEGRINTDDIATNITITGGQLVNVSDIKSWILKANNPTDPL